MQVAATHRPHPPPVPPRPSRQVVAEALKRGNHPRPPCPTRQAPPPPNIKPWRPPIAGRTVIYESKSPPKDQQPAKCTDRMVIDLVKSTQECRSRSERIENQRERPGEPAKQTSEVILNGNENVISGKTQDLPCDRDTAANRKDVVITTVARVQGTPASSTDVESSNSSIKEVKGLTKRHSSSEIKTPDESSVDRRSCTSKTTITEDNCTTTVVVIEETEHKITINEDNKDNIQHKDWLEAGVRYSSTKITLPGDDSINESDKCTEEEEEEDGEDEAIKFDLDFSSIRERIAMSSLQGLPPLPRSLSGFNLSEGRRDSEAPPPPPARSSSKSAKGVKTPQSSSRPSPPSRQLTTLDTQLAILRKEMFGLRQLDLSLLSQLWSLNESIQEFRQLLQEQEDRVPSSSPSSEDGDESSYHGHPPPPPRRPAPLLHHHRPPRPPRPLRPPPSDESPSSEEYGAV